MILGALWYLGRVWTFDDIEEETAINEETHRQLFHIYIAFGSTDMYEIFVIVPASGEEAATHLKEMETDSVQNSYEEQEFWMTRLDWVVIRLNQFEICEAHENCISRWKQCCSGWKQCWIKTMYK